jgi:hypothetical protein
MDLLDPTSTIPVDTGGWSLRATTSATPHIAAIMAMMDEVVRTSPDMRAKPSRAAS